MAFTHIRSVADAPGGEPLVRPSAKKRPRQPVLRFVKVLHRWLSLVAALILVVITTSGALLEFQPEITKFANASVLTTTDGPVRSSMAEAVDVVRREQPQAKITMVQQVDKSYIVGDSMSRKAWAVDATTGVTRGSYGFVPPWLGWLQNLHECAFSCEGRPGYLPVMRTTIPGTEWLHDGKQLTVAGLLLGGTAVTLLLLAITGLWVWWPRAGRWKNALRVRLDRGRFARDTDLHKVIGLVAIPLLLIWGWTGTGFELASMKKMWMSVVGASATPSMHMGGHGHSAPGGTSNPQTSTVGIAAAMSAAQSVVPGGAVSMVTLPDPAKAGASYTVRLARPAGDAMAYSVNRGDVRVSVDGKSGHAMVTRNAVDHTMGQYLWDVWNYPLHTGYFASWWVRLVWALVGLAPLALAVTGVSTWLVRRKSQRERAKASSASASVV